MDEKKREEIALFRYGLIVPFLAPEELEWGVKGELLKRMVKQTLSMPFSKKTSLPVNRESNNIMSIKAVAESSDHFKAALSSCSGISTSAVTTCCPVVGFV